MLPEDSQLPEGLDGLPKFSDADVAEAARKTKDKWTNAAGITDVSQMGGQVKKVNFSEDPKLVQEAFRQRAMEGVRNTPPASQKPAPASQKPAPASREAGTRSEDGEEKIVPTQMYLDAKKEWKAEQEKLYARLDEADRKIMNLNEFIMAQEARMQPPPYEQESPEEEIPRWEPILDEDGNEDPRFTKMMEQAGRREEAIIRQFARKHNQDINAVKSASAKQAVNSILNDFFAETGVDPKSKTGKTSKEVIVSLITALPPNMKERASAIWKDRLGELRAEILEQDKRLAQKKKEEVKTRHGTETPQGSGAGQIPDEYLDRRIPARIRAENWLRHQEALRKAQG